MIPARDVALLNMRGIALAHEHCNLLITDLHRQSRIMLFLKMLYLTPFFISETFINCLSWEWETTSVNG